MRTRIVVALFVAMVCTFCFARDGLAGKTANSAVLSQENPAWADVRDFRPMISISSHGDTGVMIGRSDIFKVLTVLGDRIEDPRLLKEARYKLIGMSERRLQLAVSLSERVADDASRAETHIAFLLLTTLIVFS